MLDSDLLLDDVACWRYVACWRLLLSLLLLDARSESPTAGGRRLPVLASARDAP